MYLKTLVIFSVLAFAVAVEVILDSSGAPDLIGYGNRGKQLIESEYEKLSRYLSTPDFEPPATVYLTIDPEYDGVAYAADNKIVVSANYIRDTNQRDFGVFIHEVTHVIQSYQQCAGWVTEGIADFTRRFHYIIPFTDQPMTMPPDEGAKWEKGYGDAAYFFNWIHQNYRNDMVYWLNRDCREGTYNDGIFQKLIGKDIPTLWNEMQMQFNYLN